MTDCTLTLAATSAASGIDAGELARHRPQLVKFATLKLRDAAHAEDVVQETLLAALRGAERFQGDASVRTWLTGILKHKILDHFRRQRREAPLAAGDDPAALEGLETAPAEPRAPGSAAPSAWDDPEAALAQRRFFAVLERGLARLSGNTARAFHMREVLGMSTDEICAELGITASHCAVLLHRARASLRDYLQREWFGADAPPGGGRDRSA